MKKITYLIISLVLCSGIAATAKASFDPSSQTIVDLGSSADAQISSTQNTDSTTASVAGDDADYDWFTPAIQAELDSLSASQPTINLSLINY